MVNRFFVGLFFGLFFVGFACAEVSFNGVVYEGDLGGDVIEGVETQVFCGDYGVEVLSYSDGAYGVDFLDFECEDGDELVLEFSKDGFEDLLLEDLVDYSSMWVFEHEDFVLRNEVYNVVMVRDESSEIRHAGTCNDVFWDCGLWSSCVEGVEVRSCYNDCQVFRDEIRACDDDGGILVLEGFVGFERGDVGEKVGFWDFVVGLW